MKEINKDSILKSVKLFLEEILKDKPDYILIIRILNKIHETRVTDSNIGTYIKDIIWSFITNNKELTARQTKKDERDSQDPAYYKVFNYFVKKNKLKFSRNDTREVLNNFIEICQIVFLASKSINTIPVSLPLEDYQKLVLPDLEGMIETINNNFIKYFKNEYSINETVRFHIDHSNRGLSPNNIEEDESESNKDAEEEIEGDSDYSKYESSDEDVMSTSCENYEDNDTSIDIYEVDRIEDQISAFQDKIVKLNYKVSSIEQTNNLLIPTLEKMAIILHYKNKIDSYHIEINKLKISQINMSNSIQRNKTLLRVSKKIINDIISKSKDEGIATLVNRIVKRYQCKSIKAAINDVFKSIEENNVHVSNLNSVKEQIKLYQQEIEVLINRIKNSENCTLLTNIYSPAGIAQLRRRGLIMERLSKKEPGGL